MCSMSLQPPLSCVQMLGAHGSRATLSDVRFRARDLKHVSPRGPKGRDLIAVLSKMGLMTFPARPIFVVYIFALTCVPHLADKM